MFEIGFRVYTDKAPVGKPLKTDHIGTFIGWTDKFDEKIPAFHPRIQPFKSREGKTDTNEHDIEDDQDYLFKHEEENKRVYAVTRRFQCISVQYMNFINYFGNEGGFDMLMEVLEKAELDEHLTIQVMGCLATQISLPANLYHKEFMDQYGTRICDSIKARLIGASDKSLRNVRKE